MIVKQSAMSAIGVHKQPIPGKLATSSPGTPFFKSGFRETSTTQMACAVHRIWALFLMVLISPVWCYSADLLFIRSAGAPSSEQQDLEVATQFYGLNLRVITAGSRIDDRGLISLPPNDTVGVVIEANALSAVNHKALLSSLRGKLGASIPLLIVGVTSETDQNLLRTWSGGEIVGARALPRSEDLRYSIGSIAGVTEQLTNLEIPFQGKEGFSFVLAGRSGAYEVMSVRSDRQVVPVFVETDLRQQKVFLLCKQKLAEDRVARGAESTEAAFSPIAPVMIFTKFCAGSRGWHALEHYANFTIDDPWLREPYGFLNYTGLLKEMQEHNFHTTIAFIPWNYDRSEAGVVALFRNYPERYSICIHGDNHDHKEFDDFKSKAFNLQIAAVRQSLARMEEFQRLTGIPYDHVFVFPHNIGSESILKQLKTDNFTATINSLNVPINRNRPPSLLFTLRPVTLSFAGFPSIARFSPSMQDRLTFIAINGFLDNPVLFYAHHDFFATGIDAFDAVADQVNKIQPNTRWRSVGDIAKHLYLVRLRADSEYDVRAFSNDLELNNAFGRDSVFYIQRPESDPAGIALVSVDGRPATYQVDSGILQVMVKIPAGESRHVVIRYKNDLDLVSVSISKSSLRVYFLRTVSDFRDITLSKFSAGRTVIAYYYGGKMSLLTIILCGSVVIVFGICTTWGFLLIVKRKNTAVLVPSRRSR